MKSPEMGMKYDPYEKDIPHQGSQFEEDGKIVYWNMANAGSTPEQVMAESDAGDGSGRKPLEAKYIDTPDGKKVIVKWEAKKE
jgi:hypothetical protein